jgi:hypothetical protein
MMIFRSALLALDYSMPNDRPEIRSWSPEEEAQLLALLDEGMTANEIGAAWPYSPAVYGRLQRFRKQQGRVSRTSGDDPSRNAPAQNHG